MKNYYKDSAIANVNDFCHILTDKEITDLIRSHPKTIPLFWNFYLSKNNYKQMCKILSLFLPTSGVIHISYVNDMIELMNDNKPGYEESELATMALYVLPHVDSIPDGFQEFLLKNISNSSVLAHIIRYADKDFLIKTKIELLTKRPSSIDYFVNYLCSSVLSSYTMDDFFSDLPEEYKLGVIV